MPFPCALRYHVLRDLGLAGHRGVTVTTSVPPAHYLSWRATARVYGHRPRSHLTSLSLPPEGLHYLMTHRTSNLRSIITFILTRDEIIVHKLDCHTVTSFCYLVYH